MKHEKGITQNKLQHMLGVARKCYKIAKERGYSEDEARRLFLIGYIHDIGYEFTEHSEEHPVVGNNIIKTMFKDDLYAVLNHGNPDADLSNIDLEILNIADLTVDSFGNECSIYGRLSGIKYRYGDDSGEYKNSLGLAKKLKLVDDNFGNNSKCKDVEVNSHGVNKNIKVNYCKLSVLSKEKLNEIGFTEHRKGYLYFCRGITFPKNKYKNLEVTFSVTISRDGSDIRIDVLDEAFCQPYDYQRMLQDNPEFEPALIVREQVETWMKYLTENGIIYGHNYGDYI